MKKKDILIVIIPLLLIIILVIIKSLSKDGFSIDAMKTHELSLNPNHIVSPVQLKEKFKSIEKIAIVDLRSQNDFKIGHLKNAVNIPFSGILSNQELEKLKSSDYGIVLYSNSISETAKAWTILSKLGYQKLSILDIPGNLISENLLENDSLIIGDEVLKYKFQTDTIQ